MITDDAVAMAEEVRSGRSSPLELVNEAIARIEARDPALRALSWTRFDEALNEARGDLPNGPFRGVPILLKDHRCLAAGQETRFGTNALATTHRPWGQDSNIYRAIRDAGFVVLGRTTTPEFATSLITESEAAGVTRNPSDLQFTAGGSSGGSAAAVAAGMVPVAHATDGGGSIRIPAAACGLVGLKASRGRVSLGPDTNESWAGATTEGTVCRTVRDAAATFDVVSRYFPGDPYVAPPVVMSMNDALTVSTPRLRIGVLTTMPDGSAFADKEAGRLTDQIASVLDTWGHEVTPEIPEALTAEHFAPDYDLMVAVDVELLSRKIEDHLGVPRGELELNQRNVEFRRAASELSAPEYLAARYRLGRWMSSLAHWWEGFDILLTPTLAGPISRAFSGSEPSMEERSRLMVPLTSYFNVGGQPAISLPLGRSSHGLPIGIQAVARYGREDQLIQLARDFELRGPWHPGSQ